MLHTDNLNFGVQFDGTKAHFVAEGQLLAPIMFYYSLYRIAGRWFGMFTLKRMHQSLSCWPLAILKDLTLPSRYFFF